MSLLSHTMPPAPVNSLHQSGIVGPWRPAFFLSIFMLILTSSVIYWNEHKEGTKICQSPGFGENTRSLITMTVGATIGHFVVQASIAFSKYESNKHSSASAMVVLITGIQAASQIAMVSNFVETTCEDYFGVRTSMFLWVEWMSTVPIMFYLTTIMDVNKFQLTQEDKLVILSSSLGLFCLYLLNFGTVSPIVAVLLMIMANVLMTGALFWLHGTSYFSYLRVVQKAKKFPEVRGPLNDLYIAVKKRKLLCSGFMNYFFTLFPVAYYLKCTNVIDHDTFYVTFCILNFICKGIFAALVIESHSDLLDPKTFLLFSEKERMETDRRTFMRNVFHEVHVPLKSLSLGLKLLNASSDISESDRQTVHMVTDAYELMTESLTDVLAAQKVQKGELMIVMAPFYVSDLMQHVRESFQRQVAAKSLHVTYQVSAAVPHVVKGDSAKLDQVVSCFLCNAIRYSSKDGAIAVSVTFGTRVPDQITFSVRDSGPGIPQSVLGIFGVESGSTGDLAVCGKIVRLHGGTIGCDSPPFGGGGIGSEVYCSLPLEECEEDDDDDDM